MPKEEQARYYREAASRSSTIKSPNIMEKDFWVCWTFNRIAHHESIIRKDLPLHNERIINMIRWFCKETALWIESQNRFEKIWKMPINPYYTSLPPF